MVWWSRITCMQPLWKLSTAMWMRPIIGNMKRKYLKGFKRRLSYSSVCPYVWLAGWSLAHSFIHSLLYGRWWNGMCVAKCNRKYRQISNKNETTKTTTDPNLDDMLEFNWIVICVWVSFYFTRSLPSTLINLFDSIVTSLSVKLYRLFCVEF